MNVATMVQTLIGDEDLRLKPYRCTAGKLSIGVGRNLDDVGITREEAVVMCVNDINRCATELDRALPWWRKMTEARQHVLLNMCFNLGIGGLLTFKNTLAAMEAARYTAAAEGMRNSKWAEQVGHRAARLACEMQRG